MPRTRRPDFDPRDLDNAGSDEAKARLVFDWWCHEGERGQAGDRQRYLESLGGGLAWILSRTQVEDDPAPPRSVPARQGHVPVALLTDARDVARALADAESFSNVPYAELGGASFMLALDPGAGNGQVDWHAEQRRVAQDALARFAQPQLRAAAARAAQQAAALGLAAPGFDLAEFAEQAALRYFGLVFGFSTADHALLEEAARRGYRALQYLIVGRHFVSEPATLPAAQQALARLSARTAVLIDEYATLHRAPRPPRPDQSDDGTWPTGVQPWGDLDLGGLGVPVLRLLPGLSGRLNGQDLCALVGGLLVGTVGNVQTAICLAVHALLGDPVEFARLQEAGPDDLLQAVRRLLAQRPPVPFLPRRTRRDVQVRGGTIPAATDCILALPPSADTGCPWGAVRGAVHGCLGREFIEPLLVAVLRRVLSLPDLQERLDGVTGEALAPERLWGFGCLRYPLRYRRDKERVQQPLIVIMPVRAPIAENAERLRRVIRAAAPRIEWVLRQSGMVHVAWFEFLERDTQLALRTVYDGDFDGYVQHFALRAGELFDQIFECIEGAPPLPVAEYPNEFVETIRRFNRVPLAGYFFSAYPGARVSQIAGRQQEAP